MTSRPPPTFPPSVGYVVASSVFTGGELDGLRRAADHALESMVTAAGEVDERSTTTVCADGHRLQSVDGATVHWEPEAPGVVRSISPVVHLDQRLDAVSRDVRLTGWACEVLGASDVELLRSALNVKKSGVGSEYRWHQDDLGGRSANVMLFLDDACPDNGPLQVLPGTHHSGLLRIDPDDPLGSHPDPALIDDSNATVITVGAGSVVAFSALLVHRSDVNRSDRDRRALRFCFRARA